MFPSWGGWYSDSSSAEKFEVAGEESANDTKMSQVDELKSQLGIQINNHIIRIFI